MLYISISSEVLFQQCFAPVPCGEKTLRLMGMGEMPLFAPVTRSVSASISWRTSSKSVNFFPLQCRNSAHSVESRRHGKDTHTHTHRFLTHMHVNHTQILKVRETASPVLALMSCRTRGLRVTMPDPRGRKSLENTQNRTSAVRLTGSTSQHHHERPMYVFHCHPTRVYCYWG